MMSHMTPRRGRQKSRRRGFTLIETALATVIVGVGVLAMVTAQQAFHKQNHWSTHASIAERLGNEIREMTLNLPRHDPVTASAFWGPEPNETWVGDYDDVDDFDGDGGGLIFGADWDPDTVDPGPINARREVIVNMRGWTQVVTVRKVNAFDINQAEADDEEVVPTMMLVEVAVLYQGPGDDDPTEITTVSWVAPN